MIPRPAATAVLLLLPMLAGRGPGGLERMLRSRDPGLAARGCRIAADQGARALPLLRALLDDRSWEVRARAVALLGEVAGKRETAQGARDALIATLKDPSWAVRREAAVALGRLEDARVVPALLVPLGDPIWAVRRAAVRALRASAGTSTAGGGGGGGAALEPLVQSATYDPDPDVRSEAAAALSALRSERAVPFLLERIRPAGGGAPDLAALGELWLLPGDRAREAMRGCLRSRSRAVRVLAAAGLLREGDREILQTPGLARDLILSIVDPDLEPPARRAADLALALARDWAAPHLRAAASDPEIGGNERAAGILVERLALDLGAASLGELEGMLAPAAPAPAAAGPALEILARCAAATSLPPILTFLKGTTDTTPRRRALEALRRFPPDAGRPPLLRALGDTDPRLRLLALRALADHPSAALTRPFLDLAARDPDPRVRRQAIFSLARLGALAPADSLVPPLRAILDSGEPPATRAAALGALARTGSLAAGEILLEIALAPDRDAGLRRGALILLGKLPRRVRPPRLMERAAALVAGTESVPIEVRRAALGTLAREEPPPDWIAPLLVSLLEREGDLRSDLLRALRGSASPKAARALARALAERRWDTETLVEAVETLGTLDPATVAPPVLALIRDGRAPGPLRAACVRAVAAWGKPQYAPPLVALLEGMRGGRETTGGGAGRPTPDEALLAEVVVALCRLGEPRGVDEALRTCLDEIVREEERPGAPSVWNLTLIHALHPLEPSAAATALERALGRLRASGRLRDLGEDRFFRIADAARRAGMPRIAEPFYRLVLETFPGFTRNDFEADLSLGRILENRGRYDEAAGAYRRAAAIARSEGWTLEPQGPQAAARPYPGSRPQAGSDVPAGSDSSARLRAIPHLLEGVYLLRDGDEKRGLAEIARARAIGAADAWTQIESARYLIDLGVHPEAALEAAGSADALAPDSPGILETLAEASLLAGRREQGLAIYDRMVLLPGLADTERARFLRRAAELWDEQGDRARARELAARARTLEPSTQAETSRER